MRIGIDARELCGHATGVGRYLAGLLAEWSVSADASGHQFFLYAPAPVTTWPAERFTPRTVPGRGTVWEQWHLPRAASADRLDAFFAPAYSAPLLMRTAIVVAIHDVSYAAHPEWFTRREGLRRTILSRATARRARAVVTISEFSKSEIVRHFGIEPAKIAVIPPGIDKPARSAEAQGAKAAAPSLEPRDSIRLQTPASNRILFVGSIFNRRHVPILVQAVGQLAERRPGVTLDLVGDNRSHPAIDLDALIARDGRGAVRWHRYVDDATLEDLYRSAGAFAFLSEYEGLGLTPLEALARGVPPLLLQTTIARESCGDAALYVAPTTDAVASGLEALLHDAATRARLRAAAPAVLRRYDWTTAARATLALITGTA